jgi:glucoamylase
MKEAQQLAAGLRANGKKMSEHLQEFAMLAKKVSTAMRDTRAELSPPGATPESDALLPQQVWDTDIPERELFRGGPAGTAMPLVWAHAEHMELRRSVREDRVFDMPPQPIERHQTYKTESLLRSWRFNEKTRSIPAGKKLRIELLAAARVRWTANEWATSHDDDTREIGFGIHLVDLPTQNAARGSHIRFTFYWRDTERWEGMDFAVKIGGTEDIDTAVALEPPN